MSIICLHLQLTFLVVEIADMFSQEEMEILMVGFRVIINAWQQPKRQPPFIMAQMPKHPHHMRFIRVAIIGLDIQVKLQIVSGADMESLVLKSL